MVEECGILSNLFFHFMASYHIYYQALPSFPGFAWPGLDPLRAPSTCKTRHASFSGWGKRSSGLRCTVVSRLNSVVKSTSFNRCVSGVPRSPLEAAAQPVLGEEDQAVLCSDLALSSAALAAMLWATGSCPG